MRLAGPNCLGIFNPVDRAMLSSSLALEEDDYAPGGIGMVSQSGALMGTLLSFGRHHARASAVASRWATGPISGLRISSTTWCRTTPRARSACTSKACATPRATPCCARRATGFHRKAGAVRPARRQRSHCEPRRRLSRLRGDLPRCRRRCWKTRRPVSPAMAYPPGATARCRPWPRADRLLRRSTVTCRHAPAVGCACHDAAVMPRSAAGCLTHRLPVDTGSFHEGTSGDGVGLHPRLHGRPRCRRRGGADDDAN